MIEIVAATSLSRVFDADLSAGGEPRMAERQRAGCIPRADQKAEDGAAVVMSGCGRMVPTASTRDSVPGRGNSDACRSDHCPHEQPLGQKVPAEKYSGRYTVSCRGCGEVIAASASFGDGKTGERRCAGCARLETAHEMEAG